MSETVTVTEVGETNQWGYGEVKFAERGPAKTRNSDILARAKELVGEPSPAVINETTNAKGYTNVYLNEFAGIKDKPVKGGARANGGTSQAPRQDDNRQKTIQAQWAFGRAVELLIGSGVEYNVPLTADQQKNVDATAAALLAAANTLAGA